MNETQKKCLRLFAAWVERWGYSPEQAATQLNAETGRRVTAEQVQQILDRKICPSPETFRAWSQVINSSPDDKDKDKYDPGKWLEDILGMRL